MSARFITKRGYVKAGETLYEIVYQDVHPHKKNAGPRKYKMVAATNPISARLHFFEWASKRKNNYRFIEMVLNAKISRPNVDQEKAKEFYVSQSKHTIKLTK